MTTPARRIRPAISWPGGKSRLLKHILPLISEHTCYCEPFAGGLAVLLAKPKSALEVVNDISGDLVTFYRCVKFHLDPLLTELEFVLNSRQEFLDYRNQPGLTDIQRAARWFFRNKNCFGGADMRSFGTAALGGGPAYGSREGRLETIRALNWRLDRTCIENLSWEKCLKTYDRPTTFFFCDPPYTECGETLYAAWKETDVRIFRDHLDKLAGKWLVTLNDCAANRAIFADCNIQGIERAKGINAKATDKIFREIVITPRQAG